MRIVFLVFALLGFFNSSANLDSREYDGIVAVVNGDVITSLDLEKRIFLTLLSTGGGAAKEVKQQIMLEVLKEMVKDLLKWQCAVKYSPKGGWVTDEMVEATFSDIAKRNNLSWKDFCELLESKGISKDIVIKQIRMNLSWIAYVNARFIKFVNISESEINKTLVEIKEKQNQESFYVHRMFFPVSNTENEKTILCRVNNLKKMLLQGADFGNLARQFSNSPDANKGGEIGWVFHGQLAQEESQTLQKMAIGEYAIVRNSRGYVILFLQDKKSSGSNTFTNLKFVQVAIPIRDPNPDKEIIKQLMDYIANMKKSCRNCNEFIKQAKNSDLFIVSDPITTVLEGIKHKLRSIVSPIRSGCIGTPFVAGNAVIVICMLDRKTQNIPEPTYDNIKSQKINERLSVFSDREMQNLKNKADIKINAKYGKVFDFVR